MTITLDLSEEQSNALASAATVAGRESAQDWLLNNIIIPAVNYETEQAYKQALIELGEAARGLSYEQRKQIMADVAQKIGA